jgi:hypothetical protein
MPTIALNRRFASERQRKNGDLLACLQIAPDPRFDLHDVRHHVAVGEHGPLGDAGRAPCVLQKRHIVASERHFVERFRAARTQRRLEVDRTRDAPIGHQVLHVFHREIDEQPLRLGKQISHLSRDDAAHGRPVQHLLQRVREILQHDDAFRAGIVQLVRELSCRVQRVRVDGDQPRAQHAEERDRILEQVRQHDRDASVLFEARHLLQEGGERAARAIELGVCHRYAHVAVRGKITETLAASREHFVQRREFAGVDLGRDVVRVLAKPALVHVLAPGAAR